MLKRPTIAISALAALSLSALPVDRANANDLPRAVPTARDVYVGCYLSVSNEEVPKDPTGHPQPFSAAQCELYALLAITNREGYSQNADNKYRFCLPKTKTQPKPWLMPIWLILRAAAR
jgi:hypothetical protein